MTQEYLNTPQVIAKVIKNWLLLKYPDIKVQIILTPQKIILSNTFHLQIIIEKRSIKDLSNVNTTIGADLPNETIGKIVLETYAINFVSYTNDKGFNFAEFISSQITGIFNTQQALYEFQKNKIYLPYIWTINNISGVEGVETLARWILELQTKRIISISSIAEYYDDFENKPNFNFNA